MHSLARTAWSLVALLGICGSAAAQINPIGPFDGERDDSWETQTRFQFLRQYPIFNDGSTVDQVGQGQGLHITTSWVFSGQVFPRSGQVFFGGAGANYQFTFAEPARRFGGYFVTHNPETPGATARFFDAGNNLLGELQMTVPLRNQGGDWTWNGWESAGAGIARIEIIGANRFNGFILSDDITYTPVPAPGAAGAALAGLALAARRRR